MISIAFRFLAGRYHATPWGHHVNEGLVEWPPSPFRLLRTLVAAHYKDASRLSEELVRRTIGRLEGAPVYRLPRVWECHTRHYMPGDGDDKPLVFDAFAAIAGGAGGRSPNLEEELVATWTGTELSPEERNALGELCRRIGYLGRAESWAEARLVEQIDGEPDAVPIEAESATDVENAIPLLTLLDSNVYAGWRLGFMEGQRGKKLEPPKTLWEVLSNDIETIQKQGWRIPPGTRWVRYEVRPRTRVRRRSLLRHADPTFARFALQSAVLPLTRVGLSVAERFRTALMSRSDAHPVFAGREHGAPSRDDHQHAFYLPTDDDGDGRIDHVVVWARRGFDPDAVQALQGLRKVWGSGGHDIRTLLVGLGHASDYAGTSSDGSLTAMAGRSAHWESFTPCVLPRHPKRRRGIWLDSPEEQVAQACRYMLGFSPVEVIRIEHPANEVNPWRGFYLERRHGGGSMGPRRAYSFRLQFESPVDGPIALGYGAHFGLGQFRPAARASLQ